MNHNLEIQKILLKVDTFPNPDDQISLLKQAIKLADVNNDLDWGFDLRLDLIAKEIDTSHCDDSFPAFAWILNTYDNNSDLFNEDDFLWEYKWMASASRRNVGIAREQVESIMEDLKKRMADNGYTNRAYYNVAMYWYLFLGEIDEARRFYQLRDAEVRDRMSHCEACELDSRVEFDLLDGNIDKAIATAHDLITKKETCGRLPFATFCNFVYYMNKAGDARASEYFEKAEEELSEIENDTSFINNVSMLFPYLAKHNKEKGWAFFEKHADWEVGAEDALSFDFSISVLPLLSDAGERTLNLSPKLPYHKTDNVYSVRELYDYYYAKAKDLAERFDARNKNTHFSQRLVEALK